MTQCPRSRIAALLLASAVAAGAVLTAGCRKDPAAESPSPRLSITGGSGKDSRTSQGPAGGQTGAAGKPDASPSLAVTADELAKEFQADDRAAGAKYKDRWLVVDGVYKEAYERKVGSTDTRMVYFADYLNPESRATCHVGCKLDAASYPDFDGLTPGQKIKVKARCAGGGFQSVSLAEGQLVEPGKDPAVEVSAAQLAKEYAANPKAAENKYNDRWLLVEGTVLQASTTDKPSITLEGPDEKAAKPVHVVARFQGYREAEPGKVKKGDKVKLKGKAIPSLDDTTAVLEDCKLVK